MDGVIIDTEPLYLELNQGFFGRCGITVSVEEQMTYAGASGYKMWSEIKAKYGLPQSVDWLIDNEKQGIYRMLEQAESIPVVDGVRGLLEELRRLPVRVGLASSSPSRTVSLVLERLSLRPHFEAIVGGEEIVNGKPEPDIFIECAKRLGTPPECAIVLEDSVNGVRAGKAAGMKVIAFENPNSGPQDLAGADLRVDNLGADVVEFVRRHAGVRAEGGAQ
jgi:HAD superfamily hydrolase (TIGR01509 family)